jgi:hypothetical protein
MPALIPDEPLFRDPDRLQAGELEPIRNLNPLPRAGQQLCSCGCGWFGPENQRQSGACPACGSTFAKKPSKASIHIYDTLVRLLSDDRERLKGTQVDCLSLRAMVDQAVGNCRTLQDLQAPLTAKAAALDAIMQLIGFAPESPPDDLPAAVQAMMADQLRYAMHRDVLRVDPVAWDGVQDFPQHKLSAAEYDLATDRKIMRWRHIQQQPDPNPHQELHQGHHDVAE